MKHIYVISQARTRDQTEYVKRGDWYKLMSSPYVYALKSDGKEAMDFVFNNLTDLNEAGYYPYVTIEEYPMGVVCEVENTWVFEWNNETKKYDLLDNHKHPLSLCSMSIGAGCYE